MKISDIIKDQENPLRVIKINEKTKLKVNLRNLTLLIRELIEMKKRKLIISTLCRLLKTIPRTIWIPRTMRLNL